jgi:hypothetical protein
MRWKAALSLAWLYAVCILLPPAAFALSAAAHCLTDTHAAAHVHQAAAKIPSSTHVHPDGVVHAHGEQGSHQHADGAPHKHDADDKSHGNCCGLFCVTAIAHAAPALLAAPGAAGPALPALEEALSGRGPDRINRPPIA